MPMLIALVIWGAFMWWWTTLMFAIGLAFLALVHVLKGQFIRATIWSCISAAGWFWLMQDNWIPEPYQFDKWLRGSATLVAYVVGFILVIKGLRMFHRWRRGEPLFPQPVVPAFGQIPEITGNVIPFVHATRQEKERVMQIQNHRCANPYCNADLRDGVPHWDHIKPRSVGGTDSVHNGQWLCDTCNMNKGDMDWCEFLFRYATGMGQDPNINQKPWQKWVLSRSQNGLQCQG